MPKTHKHPIEKRVLAYLYLMEGQPRRCRDIARRLEHPNAEVRNVCAQLAHGGQLEACGPDTYRMPREDRRNGE